MSGTISCILNNAAMKKAPNKIPSLDRGGPMQNR